MLLVISPAKTLDFQSMEKQYSTSFPSFLGLSTKLIDELRNYKAQELESLMSISPKLADLNRERFLQWQLPFTSENSKPAVFAFRGDVYTGLDVDSLTETETLRLNKHLRILSGLYGVLRPLDGIQAYRLEMGTKLENEKGNTLYKFWGDLITNQINNDLIENKYEYLINLASNEYFKSIDKKQIKKPIITPVFKDYKNGTYKVISFYAKKARGFMTRFIIQNQINTIDGLKTFDQANYLFNNDLSTDTELVFTR